MTPTTSGRRSIIACSSSLSTRTTINAPTSGSPIRLSIPRNARTTIERYCVDLQNRIVTIFAGAHIKPGDYAEGKGITHVNVLRTIEAMYGLSKAGRQQPNAAGMGISDDYLITDVFLTVK